MVNNGFVNLPLQTSSLCLSSHFDWFTSDPTCHILLPHLLQLFFLTERMRRPGRHDTHEAAAAALASTFRSLFSSISHYSFGSSPYTARRPAVWAARGCGRAPARAQWGCRCPRSSWCRSAPTRPIRTQVVAHAHPSRDLGRGLINHAGERLQAAGCRGDGGLVGERWRGDDMLADEGRPSDGGLADERRSGDGGLAG